MIALLYITPINIKASKFYSKKILILNLTRVIKCRIKHRSFSSEIYLLDKVLNKRYKLKVLKLQQLYNNLASLYIARKRIIAWYQHQIVHRRTRVKPHPHLGLQRLQRLDDVQNQQPRTVQLYTDKNKLSSGTATNIYFKSHDIKILITPV